MPSALMQNLGREVPFEACGQRWIAARLDVDVLEEFIDWLRPQLPDPFAHLENILPHCSRKDGKQYIEEAKADAILDYDSKPVVGAMRSKRGAAHLFWFMLRRNHPDCTLGDAFAIIEDVGEEKLADIMQTTSGKAKRAPGKPVAPVRASEPTGEKSHGA